MGRGVDGCCGWKFGLRVAARYGRLIWVRLINPRLTLLMADLAITVTKIRQIMEVFFEFQTRDIVRQFAELRWERMKNRIEAV